MILMTLVPIGLTIVPVLIYQMAMRSCKRKSTYIHYFWTYIMMVYIWLVFSVAGIGSVWEIISKGGLAAAFKEANISLIPFQSEGIYTYFMNVIMFMPLGFLLPYIWKNFRSLLKTALTGLFFRRILNLPGPYSKTVSILRKITGILPDGCVMDCFGTVFLL